MDIYSLAATRAPSEAHPAPMNARAEDQYYAKQLTLPRLSASMLGSIAMMAGVFLLFGITLI